MMKYISFLLIGMVAWFTVPAQIDQPSVGAGYSNMTFYSLSDGTFTQYDHTIWDISFDVSGQGLGVFINEGVASSMSAPLPEVELFLTSSTDFASIDTAGMERIFNHEISWSAGAFNHVSDTTNPFDFGWGAYDPMTHQVNSSRIFAIKLRNGDYKKLEIQSLISGVYTFRYADLDGSNEIVKTITKADFPEKTLAYYSIEADSTLDLEPSDWDLVFTRYYTPLDDGSGGILNYMVTGTLGNAGITVAEANGVDPMTVDHEAYTENYSDTLTTIGHDWKAFDLGSFQWVIPSDLVYFVKTEEGKMWKVQFLDFEGSSTGTITLEKTLVSESTALEDDFDYLQSYQVFPNPATDQVSIAFELKSSQRDGFIQLTNHLGQIIQQQSVSIQPGLNVKKLSLDLPTGLYHLSLKVENDFITKSLLIK